MLAYIDLSQIEEDGTLAYYLSFSRALIFGATKSPILQAALTATAGSGSKFQLRLNRARAIKQLASGKPDRAARNTLFAQAFRAIHPMPARTLRRTEQLYETILLGERAQDAGGPYRESLAAYAAELQVCAVRAVCVCVCVCVCVFVCV